MDDVALTHIFRVTSSLDSMVLGEPEITGQVKEAWAQAQQQGTRAWLDPHAGSYGISEVKQLLKELRRLYKKEGDPDPPRFIDGFRVSGTRAQIGGRGGYLKYKIPLSAGIPLPPLPLDATDEEIDRLINAHLGGGP